MKRAFLSICMLGLFITTYAQQNGNKWFLEPVIYACYNGEYKFDTKIGNFKMDVLSLGIGTHLGKQFSNNFNMALDIALIKGFDMKDHDDIASGINSQSVYLDAEYFFLNKSKFRLSFNFGFGVENIDVSHGTYSGNWVQGILPFGITVWTNGSSGLGAGMSLLFTPKVIEFSQTADEVDYPNSMMGLKFTLPISNRR